eukprot:g3177.t1
MGTFLTSSGSGASVGRVRRVQNAWGAGPSKDRRPRRISAVSALPAEEDLYIEEVSPDDFEDYNMISGAKLGTPEMAKKIAAAAEALVLDDNPDVMIGAMMKRFEAQTERLTQMAHKRLDAVFDRSHGEGKFVAPTAPSVALSPSLPVPAKNQRKKEERKEKKKKKIVTKLEYVRLLGRGGSSRVYLGKLWRGNGPCSKVAIKQLHFGNREKNEMAKKVLRVEVELLKRLDHRNIVSFYGVHYSKRTHQHAIIMEYCDEGSLSDILKKRYPDGLPRALLKSVGEQIVLGLRYLHREAVIHRDLKPGNILMTQKGVVKIADFDISTQVKELFEDATKKRTCVGTPHYTAPEVIQMEPYSYSADVWSLGCTLVELCSGRTPYGNCNAIQALYRMVSDEHPPIPASISRSSRLYELLTLCLQRDPRLRPTARSLAKGSWFDDDSSSDEAYSDDFEDMDDQP